MTDKNAEPLIVRLRKWNESYYMPVPEVLVKAHGFERNDIFKVVVRGTKVTYTKHDPAEKPQS